MLAQKIVNAMNAPLLSMISFSQAEMDEIRFHVREAYLESLNKPDKYIVDAAWLIVLLVNLSKNWGSGDDTRFWEEMFGKILHDDSRHLLPPHWDTIEHTISRYHKKLFRSRSNKRMLREFILYHALAPRESFDALIELLWNCYLDTDLFDSSFDRDSMLLPHLIGSLKNRFAHESNAMSGKSSLDRNSQFGGATYAIRAGLKYAFMQNPIDDMADLVSRIFTLIDQLYYNEYQSNSTADYFTECCVKSIRRLISTQVPAKRRLRNKESAPQQLVLDNIFGAYELDRNGIPILAFPEVRVFESDSDCIMIRIFDQEGAVVYSGMRHFVGEDLKRRLRRIEIPLAEIRENRPNPLRVRVELSAGGAVVYDSGDQLSRDFVLFGGRAEENRWIVSPGTYVLVCNPRLNLADFTDCALIGTTLPWMTTLCAQDGNSLSLGGRSVFFSDRDNFINCHMDGSEVPHLLWQNAKGQHRIYRGTPIISIQIIGMSPAQVTVWHNGQRLGPLTKWGTIDDDAIWKVDWCGDVGPNVFYHSVVFVNSMTGRVVQSTEFCVSDRYALEMDVSYCFGESEEVTLHFGEERITRHLNAHGEFDPVPCEGGFLVPTPNRIRWRIDNGPWHSRGMDRILWHRDTRLHNNAVLEVERNFKAMVSLSFADISLPISSAAPSCFLLGNALFERTEVEGEVALWIDKTQHVLLQVARNPRLLGIPQLDLVEGMLIFDATSEFVGDLDTRFDITILHEGEICAVVRMALSDRVETTLLSGWYTIRIETVSDNFFNTKRMLLAEYDTLKLGNPDESTFVNSYIRLEKSVEGERRKVKLEQTYIRDISYLRTDLYPTYQGYLCAPGRQKTEIAFECKDSSTLRIFRPFENELLPLTVDVKRKTLSTRAADGKSVLKCSSVYYKREEAE